MRGQRSRKWLTLSGAACALLISQPIAAQVVGDDTLSVGERSQVTGGFDVQINGGARRGNNLFHSFREFSIPTGGSATFNNAPDVETIFSRITGNSPSRIDGLIRANGTANVFLLNPSGIVFGPNARLDIGGSFVASTADRINFADGFQFVSAPDIQTSPLLTISAPVGLQFGANPRTIFVQGNGHNLSVPAAIRAPTLRGTSTGLQVRARQTLALLGGNVSFQGGTITAEQGRIELGSVGAEQSIGLRFGTQGIELSYSNLNRFQDIQISQRSLVDASGGGSIQVQGNRILLSDASQFLIQNQGRQHSGRLSVNAAQLLEIEDTSLDGRLRSGLDTQTLGDGAGAEITIATREFIVRDGGAVSARSFGRGDAGNVTVNSFDSVQVIGFSPFDRFRTTSIGTVALGAGDAGDITLSTQRLMLRDGGAIAVSTLGDGNGGLLTVNADSIELIGGRNGSFTSILAAVTQGNGNGGQITVNTGRLVLRDGGTVNSSTAAAGDAGSIIINARDAIEIDGVALGSGIPSSIQASAPLVSEEIRQLFQLPPLPLGASGNVIINANRLSLTHGASLEVSNQGLGSAGFLQANVNSIFLDREGAITAATASGLGGNINLQVGNLLFMRRHSEITASANGSGVGGNIEISTPFLVTVVNEDSDIQANSQNANGGNVVINASSIFGIQRRERDTALNDITATGANFSLNGTIQLNVENFTPLQQLAELPTTGLDASNLIAAGCPDDENNSFVVTGRGGIAPTPEQQLGNAPPWRDRRYLSEEVSLPSQLTAQLSHSQTDRPLEATEWQVGANGEVILTATAATSFSPQRSQQPVCDGQ